MIRNVLIAVLLLTGALPAFAAEDLRAQVVQQLRSVGSDVTRAHKLDFYLYVPSEADAKAAAPRLRAQSLTVQIRRAATGTKWLCFATAVLVPDTPELTEIGALLTLLARSHEGEFDGWEAEIAR